MAVVLEKHVLDSLQAELRALSAEARKRFPAVKDAAERGILQLRRVAGQDSSQKPLSEAVALCDDIPQAFILGCHTKCPPLTKRSLACLNRLISYNACSQGTVEAAIDAMQGLLDAGLDHIRLCQTINTLLSSCPLVSADSMAKTGVLCFRLYGTKDPLVANTAAATLRQLSTVLFDRMAVELQADKARLANGEPPLPKVTHSDTPSLCPCTMDAYLYFQDLCHILNGDAPVWLAGLSEPPRMYSLELVECVLASHHALFLQQPEFSALVKGRVCPIVIKFFSPGAKKDNLMEKNEKPNFSLFMRLMRIVAILVSQFYLLLVTECEIFLSMLVKFLDPDKPFWQRALVIEVLHTLCSHSDLLRWICQSYDMQEHTTLVFGNMVKALDSFVQSQCHKDALPDMGALHTASSRCIFLEALDKHEAPQAPIEYGVSMAFTCLLDIVRAIALLVADAIPGELTNERAEGQRAGSGGYMTVAIATANIHPHPDAAIWRKMVDVSWCGVLTAMSLVLQLSEDDDVTESVLRGYRSFTHVCAMLCMRTPRDAFITSLCKFVVPPSFIVRVVQNVSGVAREGKSAPPQVVVSASPEDIAMSPKNMQAARALATMAQALGNLLDTAWYLVVETLQHLHCIVALHSKSPMSRSALALTTGDNKPNVQLAVLVDLLDQVVAASKALEDEAMASMIRAICMLPDNLVTGPRTRPYPHLFAIPRLLSVANHNLARMPTLWDLLVPRMLKASEDPSVDVRLCAVDCFTKLLHSMLEAIDEHPVDTSLQEKMFQGLRDLGRHHHDTREGQLDCLLHILQSFGQALTVGWPYVFIMATNAAASSALSSEEKGAAGINNMSANKDEEDLTSDVSEGDNVSIKGGDHASTTRTVRLAFESVQLVVTDFMTLLPSDCVRACIDTVGVFGQQQVDVNISLTAIGLLWNMADYLNRDKGLLGKAMAGQGGQEHGETWCADLCRAAAAGGMAGFEMAMRQGVVDDMQGTVSTLWMALFGQLASLCIDPRPEVRKSSSQTLFGTIGMHGGSFGPGMWAMSLWVILFPLLHNVQACAQSAHNKDAEQGVVAEGSKGGIMVHHSRNTQGKQWDETVVMSLAGVTGVLHTHYLHLSSFEDFSFAWSLALNFLRGFGIGSSQEVASATVSCFADLIKAPEAANMPVGQVGGEKENSWYQAWLLWGHLAINNTPELEGQPASDKDILPITNPSVLAVRPDTLTALTALFPLMHPYVREMFVLQDYKRLFFILRRMTASVSHPTNEKKDGYGAVMSGWHSKNLMPLHAEILRLYRVIQPLPHVWPLVIQELLASISLLFTAPVHSTALWPSRTYTPSKNNMYRPLYHNALILLTEVYPPVACSAPIQEEGVFLDILQTLQLPLLQKYTEPADVWRDAVTALLTLLEAALPPLMAASHEACDPESTVYKTWGALFNIFDKFLLCARKPLVAVSYDIQTREEELDVALVRAMRTHVLPSVLSLPQTLSSQLIVTLEKGSKYVNRQTSSNRETQVDDITGPLNVRENVARACFEALLDMSLMNGNEVDLEADNILNTTPRDPTNTGMDSSATDVLLRRCEEVTRCYVEDEMLAGNCPLPRIRMIEVCFVLKGINRLLTSLCSRRSTNTDEQRALERVLIVRLYPRLIACIGTKDESVLSALKTVLLQFGRLMTS